MSSAFIRSTIEVRHSSFSCLAATALSRIGATSTVCAGADAVPPPPPAGAAAPPAGVALAEWPKIALMIFPKMLMVGSQWTSRSCEGLESVLLLAGPDADRPQNLAAPAGLANAN